MPCTNQRKEFETFSFDKAHVFVEGHAAKNFIENWAKKFSPNITSSLVFHAFQVDGKKGHENISKAIKAWENAFRRELQNVDPVIAIIADNDPAGCGYVSEFDTRFNALGVQKKYSLKLPTNDVGAIEASLIGSVKDRHLFKCAKDFVTCISPFRIKKTETQAQKNWENKVIVHSLLASTSNPEGTLWTPNLFDELWNNDSDELRALLQFLEQVATAKTPALPV
jgi:hypothetical protein